ncbi:uncharacterized protein [Procambarus clarkii]|uniref:uncharacterized protein n=1 Tax=Procambarus clarkii TaxID=6728 RepID=UPI003743E96E
MSITPPANTKITFKLHSEAPIGNLTNADLSPISPTEVVSIIHPLKSKAENISKIPSMVYKSAAHALARPIALLFNKSLECHTFPDILKKAKVTPVHKGALFRSRKIQYTKTISVWLPLPKDTNDAIVSLLDLIHSALDKSEFPIGLFIDLTKAFDTVNHNYLLNSNIMESVALP